MSCHYILLDWISYSFRRSSDSEWLISWVTGQQTGENNSRGERDPPRRESEEFSSFQKHFGSAILTDDNWPYKWSSGMRLYPGTYTNRMSIMYLKKIELTSVKTLHPWRLYKRDLQSFPSHRAWDYVMFCFGTCILASVYYFSVQSRSSDLPQNFRSRNSLKLIRNISTDDGMGNSVLYWMEYWMDLQNQKLTWRPEMLISSLTHPFDPSGPERSWRAARRRRRRWARAPPAPPSASARRSRSTRTARSRCPRTATDRYSLIYSLLPYFMAIKASKCPNVLTDLYSDWLRGK